MKKTEVFAFRAFWKSGEIILFTLANPLNPFFKNLMPEKCKKRLFFLLGDFWKTGEIILFTAQNEVNEFFKI